VCRDKIDASLTQLGVTDLLAPAWPWACDRHCFVELGDCAEHLAPSYAVPASASAGKPASARDARVTPSVTPSLWHWPSVYIGRGRRVGACRCERPPLCGSVYQVDAAFIGLAYRPSSQTPRWKRGIIPPWHE
jgi:hypothetical protein